MNKREEERLRKPQEKLQKAVFAQPLYQVWAGASMGRNAQDMGVSGDFSTFFIRKDAL